MHFLEFVHLHTDDFVEALFEPYPSLENRLLLAAHMWINNEREGQVSVEVIHNVRIDHALRLDVNDAAHRK